MEGFIRNELLPSMVHAYLNHRIPPPLPSPSHTHTQLLSAVPFDPHGYREYADSAPVCILYRRTGRVMGKGEIGGIVLHEVQGG